MSGGIEINAITRDQFLEWRGGCEMLFLCVGDRAHLSIEPDADIEDVSRALQSVLARLQELESGV